MWNLTSDELASGVVALSSGHVKCSGRIGANKMYKVNNTATLELAFSPPRRLMRVELAEFSATDSGEVIASSSAKRATMKVMINFAETDVSKQIQSAYASYRFAGIDMSDFSVSAVELLPTSSDSLATDRPTSNSLAPTDAEDGGFPWWAIVIIVIGALVFAAGIGLVAFRSFKQRSGSADNKEDAPPAGRRSESSGSTELGELQTVARDLRASTVSSTSTAANYQSLQEVDQYGGLHLKDDDAPDTDLDEKSSAGTVVAKVGQYQKADISAGPGHHYDKIHPNVFNQ